MNAQFKDPIPSFKLSNDQEIPMIGLSVSKEHIEPKELYYLIKLAIKQGYRHFDSAWVYNTDFILQKAINDAIEESDTLSREDFFIASKLWINYRSKEMVNKSIDDTLKSLSLDYLDLYYIHWPMAIKEPTIQEPFLKDYSSDLFSDIHFMETYKELEKNLDLSNIGLYNFSMEQIDEVIKLCEKNPTVHQFEVNPYHNNKKMIEYCQSNDIMAVACNPFNGYYSDLLENPTLIDIGEKYNKSAAQVTLRWCIQQNVIPIVKVVTPEHLIENSEIFDFELTLEDMNQIDALNCDKRSCKFEEMAKHKLYPFKED